MERQSLGLEERTDWLLRRSAALLQRSPAPRARPAPSLDPSPSGGPAVSGDPLVQWRLRRRRAEVEEEEEPAWAQPCWAPRDPWEAAGWAPSRDAGGARWPMKDGSQEVVRRPCWRSGDAHHVTQPSGRGSGELLWGLPCWTSRDPDEAPVPMERCSHDALRPASEASQEPAARSRDPRKAPQPIRSSSPEPLWGQPCWTSPDSMEPSRPKAGISQEPLLQGPGARSRDPREAPRPIRSHSQDALRLASPLEDRGATREEPTSGSRDSRDAPQPIRSGSHDALRPPKDDSHAAPVDPLLRLLRRRRRLLWQSLRAVDSALASH